MSLKQEAIIGLTTPELNDLLEDKSFVGQREEFIIELLKREGLSANEFVSIHTLKRGCELGYLKYEKHVSNGGNEHRTTLQYFCPEHQVLSSPFSSTFDPVGFDEITPLENNRRQ